MAWCCQVLATANDKPPTAAYTQGVVTRKFLKQVARLSGSDQGPLLAKRLLEDNGIALVVMRHLPKTHLDGAALRLSDGRPVVGLTLRYDRIDSFWFCLLHELAHVGCDLSEHDRSFVDDLKLPNDDARESQADEWAQEALIPRAVWNASAVSKDPTPMNVMAWQASWASIQPSLPAGCATSRATTDYCRSSSAPGRSGSSLNRKKNMASRCTTPKARIRRIDAPKAYPTSDRLRL